MNILDKFSTVEIKADNRISEDDKAFCSKQQEAFDKSGPALNRIAEAILAAKTEQQSILGSDDSKDSYLSPWDVYLSGNSFKCDEDHVYGMMQKRNERFIKAIVDYFSRKYTVELDTSKILEHLIPTGPQEPKLPWGGYCKMSDEEIDNFKERMEAYRQEAEKNDAVLRTLPLRYEQIVDEIFVQLGGFSFQEQAMNEFLERTWNCCHKNWDGKEKFEIKNDTLRLTGRWCWCDDQWSWGPEWKPSEDLRTLLDALAWYECGRMGEAALWFPELFRCTTKENQFDICNMEKVKSVKLFKNGRVDIKFRNATFAQEFAENCLRKHIC